MLVTNAEINKGKKLKTMNDLEALDGEKCCNPMLNLQVP